MTLDGVLDLVATIFLLLGAALSAAAGIGLLRFPDALSRLHAATKPQVLGLIFVLAAIALEQRTWMVLLTLLPVLLFQIVSVPISAHMVGRTGYRTGEFRSDLFIVDELKDAVDRANRDSNGGSDNDRA